ncbi:MAG: septum formation initiator family protein [Erysipelotrichaceae bacterium]|jgi:cell division protein DivIC|nr:septum formation initiator family protein [Erysipelotrichaceae bacterium]
MTSGRKKNSRKPKRRLTPMTKIICIIALCASVFMLWGVLKEVITTVNLQRQLTEVQAELQKVTDENTYLNSEKTKLQDPDYVENYARGKYMLSKDGEQIFHLPEDTDK